MTVLTRRRFMRGSGAAFGAAFAARTSIGAAAATSSGLYIWAIGTTDIVVPSHTWTRVTLPSVVLNTTTAHLDVDKATWIFPTASASGNYAMVCNLAWDNAFGPDGLPIVPPIHRKLAQIVQQGVGVPQTKQLACPIAAAPELFWHPDLALIGDNGTLSDGRRGYQQTQVYVQTGVQAKGADQRVWVEVYQSSGLPLVCRWDGSRMPGTATTPPMMSLQAPSFMVAKLCDL
jgi:hypothetical protein